jgi:hypothetical protein
MTVPVLDYDSMRDTSIKVDWTPITSDLETGASDILSYSLEWDQASDTWISLVGETLASLDLTFTVTTNVVPGSLYSFRLRAKNEHGWGPYSEVMQATPSWVPSKMSAVVSSIENTYVKISWIKPQENGAEIEAYKILILASDSLTWLESDSCLSTNYLLIEDLYCYVPMEELTGDKFTLPYNRFISIKV